jgi:hypothetical protein
VERTLLSAAFDFDLCKEPPRLVILTGELCGDGSRFCHSDRSRSASDGAAEESAACATVEERRFSSLL